MHAGVLVVGYIMAVVLQAPGDGGMRSPPRADGPGSNTRLGLLPPLPTLPPIPTLPPAPTLPPVPTIPPILPSVPTLPPVPPLPSVAPVLPTPAPTPTSTPSPIATADPAAPSPSPGARVPASSPTDAPDADAASPSRSPSVRTVGSDDASQSTAPSEIAAPGTAIRPPSADRFDGIVLPILAVGVPILLALVILVAQLLGGAALLPAIRRTLGGVGLRRRESEPISPTPESVQPVNPEASA